MAEDKRFALLKRDPAHSSLHLKKVGDYWSVRVTKGYRALAIEAEDGLLWFWIGTHSDYERLIGSEGQASRACASPKFLGERE